MDIIRDPAPKRRKRWIQGIVAVVIVALVTVGIRQLEPAAPSVERSTIWMDTVQHGTLTRMVRGPGTLVPEERRWITAVTAGRVEEILSLPGTEVDANTVFLRLTNPDVSVELLRARQQLSQAEATLLSLRSNLETQRLAQSASVAQIRAQAAEARRQHQVNQALFERNPELVARTELERTMEEAEQLATRLEIEEQRLAVLEGSAADEIAAQENQVDRLQAIVEFTEDRVESMNVTAGVDGVLAELPVEEGEWVTAGGTLARVVQPGRLKAEIRIPQTQAQDIVVGQLAHIDTRNDTIQGRVARIDPSVQNGTVTIDVALDPGDLPASARPDLSVDGTVVIEQLDDVNYVGRPAYGQAESRVGLFRVGASGEHADRITVALGRSSVNEIEVREGVQPGDVLILSDMSQWDGFDRVRLR